MIIYSGRFQPFHNGHLSLIKQLKRDYPNDTLCVAIIKDVPIEGKDEFDKLVDGMLSKQRNPFNAEITLTLINKVLVAEKIDGVVVTLMPRASSTNFDMIKSLFDCERTWVFTENKLSQDYWEDEKAQFYQSMGDKTIRVPIEKSIGGTLIRECMTNHDYEKLLTMVPKAVFEFIKDNL